MKHTIYTQNTQRAYPVTPAMRALVKRAIKGTLDYEQFEIPTEVSVIFVDENRIRLLNAQYRARDAVTDVLSFPLFENAKEAAEAVKRENHCFVPSEPVALGDIVLCVGRAARQAQEFGHSLDRELAFLAVHSTLHLLGYDHEQGKTQEEDMRRRQREILFRMGLDRKTGKCG